MEKDQLEIIMYTILNKLDNIESKLTDIEQQANKNENVLNGLKKSQNDVRTALIDFTEEMENLYRPKFFTTSKKNEEENN